jgi:hypothetical protein
VKANDEGIHSRKRKFMSTPHTVFENHRLIRMVRTLIVLLIAVALPAIYANPVRLASSSQFPLSNAIEGDRNENEDNQIAITTRAGNRYRVNTIRCPVFAQGGNSAGAVSAGPFPTSL